MPNHDLIASINGVIAAERAYAEKIRQRGDFGRAKLIWAAVAEIEAALRSAEEGDEAGHAERLESALGDRRRQYIRDWDDEDGMGTSAFTRVFDLLGYD
jgi:hypothetical protein